MTEGYSPERIEAQRIESERSEMTGLARRLMSEAFADILPPEELEARLQTIADTKYVSEQELERLAAEHPNEADADGIMRVELVGMWTRRYAVVKHGASRAETLHTLAHESTHLMAPNGNRVQDWMREEDEQTYSVFLGPLRSERFIKDGKIDRMSIMFARPALRVLFWEAVTDWHADEVLRDTLSEDEKNETDLSGYLERQYIGHLVDQVPDREAFVKAIRTAYAEGSEDPFRIAMEKVSGRKDDQFYDELLDVLKIKPENWEERIVAWMATVKKYVV